MKITNILKIALCIVACFSVLSCKKKREYVSDGDDLSLDKIREDNRLEEIAEEKRLVDEEAKRLAEEKAREQAILDEQKRIADAEQARLDAIAAEKAHQEDIKNRQAAQKEAFKKFEGTKYDELSLLNGRILTEVIVSKISPVKVTFLHKDGVANVKYKDIPSEIRKACNFDEELMQLELERLASEGQK